MAGWYAPFPFFFFYSSLFFPLSLSLLRICVYENARAPLSLSTPCRKRAKSSSRLASAVGVVGPPTLIGMVRSYSLNSVYYFGAAAAGLLV